VVPQGIITGGHPEVEVEVAAILPMYRTRLLLLVLYTPLSTMPLQLRLLVKY
jgi:hypothetical protein